MYGQQAPLLAQQPSLSVALASAETRPCPCCPGSPFIYNRFIGGYTITLILQWLSLIFLVAGTATPSLFVAIGSGFTITFGLFHACIVTSQSRQCFLYEGNNSKSLGSDHLGQEWSAFQALTVTLCVLAAAVGVLYTLRMAVIQRSKSLPRRTELALIGIAGFVLVLAVASISLFVNCYNHVTPSGLVNVKTLGSSFTLTVAAYILQVSALLFHCYTYYQHTKASGGAVVAAAIPVRAGEPEPVPMSVVSDPVSQSHLAYTPAAAAAYMQPAFYGHAYQLPQHYVPPTQGGGVPSYYSPPQYYAPSEQMAVFAHPQYPAAPTTHYGQVAASLQQPTASAPQ